MENKNNITGNGLDSSAASSVPDELNIGMCFSGGGYRAAMFGLGALSFLNSVKLDEEHTLLDKVTALTSVSGGTIPALRYMLAKAKREKVDDVIAKLYAFLRDEDLMTLALRELNDEKTNRDASVIKIMADIYDEKLFGGAVMGDIINNFGNVTVKDYTALATDFDNSLPFRFRLTEERRTLSSNGVRTSYGVFGNNQHNIKRSIVNDITLGEALACSSCFPCGFEPMMYPVDFKVSGQDDFPDGDMKPFGIMDGGIVDNQGIDPLLLAEERMRKYRGGTRTDKALDLIIINDVAGSKEMKGFASWTNKLCDGLGKLTIGRLRNYGLVILVVMMVFFIAMLLVGNGFWLGVAATLLLLAVVGNCAGAWVKNKLFGWIRGTFVGNRADFLSHMKFAVFESLAMNRANSVIDMTSEVFLRRMRQVNYNNLYEDPEWHNRLMSNMVKALRPDERWSRRTSRMINGVDLIPSTVIQDNSQLAAKMGTTLWFTQEMKDQKMPEALMSAGQYTMCYNLICYIDKIQNDNTNLSTAHARLVAVLPQLLDAWQEFQKNPHYMLP